MVAATLTAKGHIVIPVEIRTRSNLTPGTHLGFVDEGGVIRLLIRRQIEPSDPGTGYGMIKVKPGKRPAGTRLADYDPSILLRTARAAR